MEAAMVPTRTKGEHLGGGGGLLYTVHKKMELTRTFSHAPTRLRL